MDIFLLNRLAAEIAPSLLGHRPRRLWQLGHTDLLVDFNQRDGRRLRISTDPLRLGIYLTSREPRQLHDQPRTDTGFVGLWRKHLDGMRLVAVEPLGYDRVVHFVFSDDAGEERRVVVCLTGRTSNVYLLAGGAIICELRQRDIPVDLYTDPKPPADRLDPLTSPYRDIARLITGEGGQIEAEAARGLIGFTPLHGRELAARVSRGPSLAAAWESMVTDLTSPTGQPTIYSKPSLDLVREELGVADLELILSPFPLSHLATNLQSHPASLNEAAEIYFNLIDERRRFFARRQQLASHFHSRLKKLGSLLGNLDREEARYSEVDNWQRFGDLLLINIHEAIATESGGWLVVDLFDPGQGLVEIDAAGGGTVRESAEHYFRLARKGRHSRESIAKRRPPVTAEMEAVAGDQKRLSAMTRLEDLDRLAAKYGLPNSTVAEPARQRTDRPQVEHKSRPAIPGTRRYRSGDGYEILVGRTDRDNDHLTQRVARSSDLWFHAADYPGSHVILRNPTRQPVPHRSILEAARLAAKFSQARELSKVAVNYCEKKFVTKPRGFPPGQVRLASFRTVTVEPGEAGERI